LKWANDLGVNWGVGSTRFNIKRRGKNSQQRWARTKEGYTVGIFPKNETHLAVCRQKDRGAGPPAYIGENINRGEETGVLKGLRQH